MFLGKKENCRRRCLGRCDSREKRSFKPFADVKCCLIETLMTAVTVSSSTWLPVLLSMDPAERTTPAPPLVPIQCLRHIAFYTHPPIFQLHPLLSDVDGFPVKSVSFARLNSNLPSASNPKSFLSFSLSFWKKGNKKLIRKVHFDAFSIWT